MNIVIMSDHGMTYGSNPNPVTHPSAFDTNSVRIRHVRPRDLLKHVKGLVRRVVGYGAYSQVWNEK